MFIKLKDIHCQQALIRINAAHIVFYEGQGYYTAITTVAGVVNALITPDQLDDLLDEFNVIEFRMPNALK